MHDFFVYEELVRNDFDDRGEDDGSQQERAFHAQRDCVFCHAPMHRWTNHAEYHNGWDTRYLRLCPSCGWWRALRQTRYYPDEWCDSDEYFFFDTAILKRFDISDDDAPLTEIRRILANNWKYSRHISAKRAEDLVAQVFSEHMDCEVHYLTDSVFSPDGGIDFALVERATGQPIAFRVKRRQTDHPERVQPVREFLGALACSRFQTGFFVSTAERFSRTVVAEIENGRFWLKKRDLNLHLVDGRRLKEILKLTVKRPKVHERLIIELGAGSMWANEDDQGLPKQSLEELLPQTHVEA